jgi:CheY-like chemotaxis protein
MLIEDEPIDQRMYRRVLERSELVDRVISFSLAEEALEHLRSSPDERVDLIFLDINMPRMNGFEFLEAAHKEFGAAFADMVIIMLTTSIDPKDRDRAAEFDVVRGYINKPLTIEDVKEAAEKLRNAGVN